MGRYILGIDQGTTGTRAFFVDREGQFYSGAYAEHQQFYPRPGWVEHDPEEIWEQTTRVVNQALQEGNVTPREIEAIGIANQGETVMVWERDTGKPIYNAIVWQCRRTADMAEELSARPGMAAKIQEKTGLIVDAYFSATKIRWILDNVPGAQARAEQGELVAGTLDSWLIWKLTGGERHLTDPTTASRTMLFNIKSLEWDPELLQLLDIPRSMLAEVQSTSGHFGDVQAQLPLGGLPIAGSAVDQMCALFGQACFDRGDVKNTYGTGCFLFMNLGDNPVTSENGILTTIGWGFDQGVTYAFDGGVYIAGAAIQWLRDGLEVISRAEETEELAESVPDTGGLFFVPAFVGLAAPYWDQYARGTMVGITAGTTRAHLARATLESIAYQVYNVVEAMEADAGVPLNVLRVDGGLTRNRFLMQFQADILGLPVEVPRITETTALGAAYFAGLATGFWADMDEIKGKWQLQERYEPRMTEEQRRLLYADWLAAVERSRGWEKRHRET